MTEAQHNGILKVREVVTGYGKKQVVNGVSSTWRAAKSWL